MKKFIPVLTLPLSLNAAITVDGTVDGDYGSPLAVQTVQTQFGDNGDPTGLGGGGELNGGYAAVQGDRLFVTLTGNIEPNFNKLSVFIDSKAGGENTLASLNYDFGNVAANFADLTFDSGFAADYHLYGRWGGGAFELDFVDRMAGAGVSFDSGAASTGSGTGIQSGSIIGNNAFTGTIDFGFNNTNIAGVLGGTAAANAAAAAAVTTGLEFSIPLSEIGAGPGDIIKIHAAYGNGDNNFHSNQFLGGVAGGTGNLGGDGAGNFTGNLSGVDFNNFAGDQFFEVTVPEPSTALLAFAGLTFSLRRRRS